MVEGLIRMMNTDDSIIGPVNIGNPGEFTILDLAKLVIQMTGSQSKIIYLPLPVDDPIQRRPVIEKAKKLLNNWEPKIQLREGLARTINYFQNN